MGQPSPDWVPIKAAINDDFTLHRKLEMMQAKEDELTRTLADAKRTFDRTDGRTQTGRKPDALRARAKKKKPQKVGKEKKCPNCGKGFEAAPRQKYCSDNCRKRYHDKKKKSRR